MAKTNNYLSDPALVRAWESVRVQMEKNPLDRNALYLDVDKLFNQFENCFKLSEAVDASAGADDLGQMCEELNKHKPITLTDERYEALTTIATAFTCYAYRAAKSTQKGSGPRQLDRLEDAHHEKFMTETKETSGVALIMLRIGKLLGIIIGAAGLAGDDNEHAKSEGIVQKVDEESDYSSAADFITRQYGRRDEGSRDYHSEDMFINAAQDLQSNLCGYLKRHPEATVLHDHQRTIVALLNVINKQLLASGHPYDRLMDICAAAINLKPTRKGELHTIIEQFLQNYPPLTQDETKKLYEKQVDKSLLANTEIQAKSEKVIGDLLKYTAKENPGFFEKMLNLIKEAVGKFFPGLFEKKEKPTNESPFELPGPRYTGL